MRKSLIAHPWRLLLVASIVALFCLQSQADDQPQATDTSRLCYAFLRDGRLWTACGGGRRQVSLQRKVSDFAITADGTVLVASVEKRLRQGAKGLPSETEILLVHLKDGFRHQIRENTSGRANLPFYSSCGTIITHSLTRDPSRSPYPWPQLLPGMHDVIADERLTIANLVEFRCSSDRRVVAGLERMEFGTETHLLVIGEAKQTQRFRIFMMNHNFDVSPSGSYVAFSAVQGGRSHICITEPAASPTCSAKPTGNPGADYKVSVSDSGEVVYMGDLVEDCGGTPCIGIAYWSPRLAEPLLLERNAGSPHWISPDVAATLDQYSKPGKSRGH